MQCRGCYTLGMTRYPLHRRLGGPQGLSGWVWEMLPLLRFIPWTVQPIASCYTDYTILAVTETK